MKLEILPRTELATRAFRHIADHPRASSTDIAQALGTTPGYITQVLRPLVAAGHLDSSRGPGGGYHVSDEGRRISILDLIETMEGRTDDGRCVLRGSPCERHDACALHEPWTDARTQLLEQLARTPVLAHTHEEA